MTSPFDASPRPVGPPSFGSPWSPPAPPSPPSTAPDTPPDTASRGARRGRFTSGLLVGAALTGAAVAGFAVGQGGDGDATPVPVTTAVAGQPVTTVRDGSSIADLVEAARPSIVSVRQMITEADVFGNLQEGEGAGTGFVLSADGYIATNNHVIAADGDITVTFADGTSSIAEVVAADPSNDLAVLRVDRTDLVPLPFGDSDELRLGDPLVAIGYALDLNGEPSVTAGILSAKDRSIVVPGGERLVNLLQTDTAINPGNSGGPLLNMNGEVIGINTAIAGQAQNIGFAIAITPAQELLAELQAGSVPERALLGVTTQPSPDGGAEVIEVQPGSAAEAAGIEPGDVIVAVDDNAIDDPEELGTDIARRRPGDVVVVTVERGGEELELEATLGARPTAAD